MARNLVSILNAAHGKNIGLGLTDLVPKTYGIDIYKGVPRYTRKKGSSSFVTGNPIDLVEIAGAQYQKGFVGCRFYSEMAATSGWRAPYGIKFGGVGTDYYISGNDLYVRQNGIVVCRVSAYYNGGEVDSYYGTITKNATFSYYKVTAHREGRAGHVAGTGGTGVSGILGAWNVSYLNSSSTGLSKNCHIITNGNYPE